MLWLLLLLLLLLFTFSIISSSCFCCWVYSRRLRYHFRTFNPTQVQGVGISRAYFLNGWGICVEISTDYEIWVIPHDHNNWTAKVERPSQRRSGASLSKQARRGFVLPRLRYPYAQVQVSLCLSGAAPKRFHRENDRIWEAFFLNRK